MIKAGYVKVPLTKQSKVLMAMVESVFSLFEVQWKGVFCKAMKLSQPMFGIAPKRFNHVDIHP